MKTKRCIKCGEVKPLEKFTKSKQNKLGCENTCKACRNKRLRERYANDPKYRAKRNEENKKWREAPEVREKISKSKREKRINNPEYYENFNKSRRERYANEPEYRAMLKKCRTPEKRKKDRESLLPHYVRSVIKAKYGIAIDNITEDMIERERDLIKINRLFRRQSNEGTKKIN